MKKVFIHREAAYGDHIHMSPVIRAFYEDGWEVSMLYNYKGAQIQTHNPMISHHHYFEASAKDCTPELRKAHGATLRQAYKEFDRFVTLQRTLEGALIYGEGTPEYFWPHWLRRKKSAGICFYDASMIAAGLTDPKYMGRTGEVFFTKEEHNITLDYLERFKDKYIILWALRGSMYQKAMYPIAEEICTEFIKMHPETIIITTGDEFCQQWEWDHPQVIHKSDRIPFRQALCMAKYVDLVVTPETGLGIGAGAFGTPKIMLLTAASLTNIVGNDKNDFSLQSPAWCSPCFRAIYNTRNCEAGNGATRDGKKAKFMVKAVDHCSADYGETIEVHLPICVDFPKFMVLQQMEKVYSMNFERDWTRPTEEVS